MDQPLIFDWNTSSHKQPFIAHPVETCDETLRDGIQSPSVVDPPIEHKKELLGLMNDLGITIANIGLPGAGPRAYNDVLALAQFVRDNKFSIKVNCAARTHQADIAPIADAQQKVGIPITAYCFLGTSPIRQLVEDWSLERLKNTTDEALSFALKQGLKVAFVTEDTTRSDPNTLAVLFNHALSLGVERLVLCDTVGHATPDGVMALVGFAKDIVKKSGTQAALDWHGHNDRGLALINALYAAHSGCERIHGTALGAGERVGNTSMDQLIVNLKLLGVFKHDVHAMEHYVEKASSYCQIPLPYTYPVFGADAFRTATGVHAAAVIKAKKLGDSTLADTIYSGVPAHWFGKKQIIEIGPMSGASNVKYWLKEQRLEASEDTIQALLHKAKNSNAVLTRLEIMNFLAKHHS